MCEDSKPFCGVPPQEEELSKYVAKQWEAMLPPILAFINSNVKRNWEEVERKQRLEELLKTVVTVAGFKVQDDLYSSEFATSFQCHLMSLAAARDLLDEKTKSERGLEEENKRLKEKLEEATVWKDNLEETVRRVARESEFELEDKLCLSDLRNFGVHISAKLQNEGNLRVKMEKAAELFGNVGILPCTVVCNEPVELTTVPPVTMPLVPSVEVSPVAESSDLPVAEPSAPVVAGPAVSPAPVPSDHAVPVSSDHAIPEPSDHPVPVSSDHASPEPSDHPIPVPSVSPVPVPTTSLVPVPSDPPVPVVSAPSGSVHSSPSVVPTPERQLASKRRRITKGTDETTKIDNGIASEPVESLSPRVGKRQIKAPKRFEPGDGSSCASQQVTNPTPEKDTLPVPNSAENGSGSSNPPTMISRKLNKIQRRNNQGGPTQKNSLHLKFQCGHDACDFKFRYLCDLKVHYDKIHGKPNPYTKYTQGCSLCGEMFTDGTQLRPHKKQFHSMKSVAVQDAKQSSPAPGPRPQEESPESHPNAGTHEEPPESHQNAPKDPEIQPPMDDSQNPVSSADPSGGAPEPRDESVNGLPNLSPTEDATSSIAPVVAPQSEGKNQETQMMEEATPEPVKTENEDDLDIDIMDDEQLSCDCCSPAVTFDCYSAWLAHKDSKTSK